MKQYATYLRVSTQRQGAQGLGISAQRNMCENFIKQNKGEQVQEFMDVESGTHRDRKGLWQAIDYCKKNGCGLVIAKLDRLARDVEFTFKVINTGIDIHFTDMPVVNSMILGVFAAVAQYEREMVSTRTKQALAVKKAQGFKLGASSDKYKETRAKRNKKELKECFVERGKLKTEHYLEGRDQQAFLKAIKRVFPDHTTDENPKMWEWKGIRCRCGYTAKLIEVMRDFKEMDSDGSLFKKWDFSDDKSVPRLRAYLQHFKASILR